MFCLWKTFAPKGIEIMRPVYYNQGIPHAHKVCPTFMKMEVFYDLR